MLSYHRNQCLIGLALDRALFQMDLKAAVIAFGNQVSLFGTRFCLDDYLHFVNLWNKSLSRGLDLYQEKECQ